MRRWISVLMIVVVGLFVFTACRPEQPETEPQTEARATMSIPAVCIQHPSGMELEQIVISQSTPSELYVAFGYIDRPVPIVRWVWNQRSLKGEVHGARQAYYAQLPASLKQACPLEWIRESEPLEGFGKAYGPRIAAEPLRGTVIEAFRHHGVAVSEVVRIPPLW